ncbi:helix-turn-helix transcriptional regulator [Phormidium sp. FACHB-592]|uniref:Helix-turn-helix domain-containing protein n=1 Tax=Stenomitos frigidus AS-A4 TaxID=2933935 RepID=A0ABV0KPE6_9CYAN|nr:helix-turn-helix transcriptional regulator [Phormidium sp. FACHB-592]MBD2075492.1 helix-turn-helix transcriptional regulator [Phormidium sp. FACHB-592]
MTPDAKPADLASVAALVHELRQRVGLSQEKFAAKLGVTFSTVSRWERQKAMPSPMAFDRMKELLERMGDRGQDLLAKYFPEDELKLGVDGEVPKHGSA